MFRAVPCSSSGGQIVLLKKNKVCGKSFKNVVTGSEVK